MNFPYATTRPHMDRDGAVLRIGDPIIVVKTGERRTFVDTGLFGWAESIGTGGGRWYRETEVRKATQ